MRYLHFTTKPMCLVAFAISLLSFSVPSFAGGDSYEIYLNNNLLLKRFQFDKASDLTVHLNNADENKMLIINYKHCGVTGKGRSMTIRNEKNQILKEWNFSNGEASMKISVRELKNLQKENGSLNLYYASKELMPKEKMLASIDFKSKSEQSQLLKQEKQSFVKAASILSILFAACFFKI